MQLSNQDRFVLAELVFDAAGSHRVIPVSGLEGGEYFRILRYYMIIKTASVMAEILSEAMNCCVKAVVLREYSFLEIDSYCLNI